MPNTCCQTAAHILVFLRLLYRSHIIEFAVIQYKGIECFVTSTDCTFASWSQNLFSDIIFNLNSIISKKQAVHICISRFKNYSPEQMHSLYIFVLFFTPLKCGSCILQMLASMMCQSGREFAFSTVDWKLPSQKRDTRNAPFLSERNATFRNGQTHRNRRQLTAKVMYFNITNCP